MQNDEISNYLRDSRMLRRISLRECILGLFSNSSIVSNKGEKTISPDLLDEDRFLPNISEISAISEER